MDTMKKLIAVATVAVLSLTGCQEEIFNESVGSDNYYTATEGFSSDTKTALGQGLSVVWSSGDQIAVFEGSSVGKAYQVVDAAVGSGTGEFTLVEDLYTDATAEVPNNTIAIYPFSKDLSFTSGNNGNYIIEGITFPAVQKHIAGSFSDEAFPMAAICENGSKSLSFKNIGGVLKLSLTGSYSVSQITLTGNSGEFLSGSATVTLGSDGIPSVTMSAEASISVSLVCDPAVQLDPEKETEFYISIPPTEFEAGFSVKVTDSEFHQTIKTTDKQNITERSSVLAMPELYENDFEEAETEQWVDLGLSVLWAAWNVDATSPEEYGGYYAWGETNTKSRYWWDSYTFYIKETSSFELIGNEISGTSYDVAHVKWGDGARMPTLAEGEELINNCSFTAGTYNGVKGNYLTGPNGNSIFFPFAGFWTSGTIYLCYEGSRGPFWTGTYREGNNGLYSYRLAFYHSFGEGRGSCEFEERNDGYSVRPVKDK